VCRHSPIGFFLSFFLFSWRPQDKGWGYEEREEAQGEKSTKKKKKKEKTQQPAYLV